MFFKGVFKYTRGLAILATFSKLANTPFLNLHLVSHGHSDPGRTNNRATLSVVFNGPALIHLLRTVRSRMWSHPAAHVAHVFSRAHGHTQRSFDFSFDLPEETKFSHQKHQISIARHFSPMAYINHPVGSPCPGHSSELFHIDATVMSGVGGLRLPKVIKNMI
jgi:hypothetical protein